MRLTLGLLMLVVTAACGSGNKPPHGYVEACYGGDFSKNLSGTEPLYSATLDIDPSEWAKLSEALRLLSEKHRLKYFNDTRNTESLKMIFVSLCSENGLFMFADRRIWNLENKEWGSPPLMVNIVAYRNTEQWASFAMEVDKLLREQWPQQINNKPNIEGRLMTSPL